MTDTYSWRDAIEEVTGREPKRSASPWDALSLRSGTLSEGRVTARWDDVDLTLGLVEGSLSPEIPVAITDASRGQLSPHSRLAMVQAAARRAIPLRVRDPAPDFVELAQELGVALWAVMGPRRTPDTVAALRAAPIIELQTRAFDGEEGLETSVDAIDTEGSIAPAVQALRTLSEGTFVVVNVGPVVEMETLRRALSSGADAVMVGAASRGSSMHPGLVGSSPLAAVASARRAMARARRPEGSPEPRVFVSGGFKDGLEVTKALALGADLVVMGTAPRIALGCTLCGECGPGECPKMVLGQQPPGVGEGPDWRSEADNLVAFIDRVADLARTAMAQMGCRSLGDLSLANLEARDYDTAATTGATLAGYGEPLPIWLH